MDSLDQIKAMALETIELEQKSVARLASFVNDEFVDVVRLLHEASGRLVVTGIGKSAIIGQKIVATMNSTGTPALFMHAGDAIHGDLGMIQEGDLVMILSKSGESPEIKLLIPLIRHFGYPVIALCGNAGSYLATEADYFINTTVEKEACPNNLAPTSSTTAQLVMGDALAVCLLRLKGFSAGDFARFHPGGSLGKRLYLRVRDLSRQNSRPQVGPMATLKDIIFEISSRRLGATAVVDETQRPIGIITDGDLRRMLGMEESRRPTLAQEMASPQPHCIEEGELAVQALNQMRDREVSQLLVVDAEGRYAGMVHIHDLIREGLL